ncbi:MAG: hypothetical protein Q9160_008933 [Pyrenula sp. 1 TL-2023]
MPAITWDDTNKLRLLLLVIDKCEAKIGVENWKAVAESMGGGATASAGSVAPPLKFELTIIFSSQKFYKLKKESEQLVSANGASSAPSAPNTPKTPRSRKRKHNGDGNGDGNGEDVTPKKKRNVKEKKTPAVKTEPVTAESEVRIKKDDDSEESGVADEIEEHVEE